ncbi:MAG: hypothetical protein JSS02_30420, partial [Planctomycetes bacterium]|nr:hypothetical protein [Planctomycetota bacterium]
EGEQAPLTVRMVSRTWDVHYDIGGGSRIPRISESKARTLAELRAAGIGVRRALMVHDNTLRANDLFDVVLTSIDPDVLLNIAHICGKQNSADENECTKNLKLDIERAAHVGREISVHTVQDDPGPAVVQLAVENEYDLIILDRAPTVADGREPAWHQYVHEHASCAVCVLGLPTIQREVVDKTPSFQAGNAVTKSPPR